MKLGEKKKIKIYARSRLSLPPHPPLFFPHHPQKNCARVCVDGLVGGVVFAHVFVRHKEKYSFPRGGEGGGVEKKEFLLRVTKKFQRQRPGTAGRGGRWMIEFFFFFFF